MKSYGSHVGPYNLLKVIVSEDGTYKFVAFGKTIQDNVAAHLLSFLALLYTHLINYVMICGQLVQLFCVLGEHWI